jgi:hypothetical protein
LITLLLPGLLAILSLLTIMALFKMLLMLSILTLTVLADSYTWKKCFCADKDNFGYTTNHTWYREGTERPLWWSHHAHRTLDSGTCRGDFGGQCDGLSCWRVPNPYCYPSISRAAEPAWDIPCNYGSGWKGGKICGNRYIIEYEGKRRYVPDRKKRNMQVTTKMVDCVVECKRAWPEKDMKSACSYRYMNSKSAHNGEDVPTGYTMKKNGKLEVWNNPLGKSSRCTEVHYPHFEA